MGYKYSGLHLNLKFWSVIVNLKSDKEWIGNEIIYENYVEQLLNKIWKLFESVCFYFDFESSF